MNRYTVEYINPPRNRSSPANEAYRCVHFARTGADLQHAVRSARSYELYTPVVELSANDLNEVWELCNSIEAPWAEVLPLTAQAVFFDNLNLRSMMVGDLIVDDEKTHVVTGSGFEEITP
jgi:hypothetical protein